MFITRDGTELITDSRAVALAFRKNHRDVLRTINRMHASDHREIVEHAQRNFALSGYADPTGRSLPMYRMTAKGLSELAMSFTGDDARVMRICFINAFEEVTERLARAERSRPFSGLRARLARPDIELARGKLNHLARVGVPARSLHL